MGCRQNHGMPPSPHSWQPQAQCWLEHHLASLPLLLSLPLMSLVESSLLQAQSSQLQLFPTQVPPASKSAKNINKCFKTSQNRSKATRCYQNLSDILSEWEGCPCFSLKYLGYSWVILGRLHLTFGNCRRSVCLSIHWHRCRFWCRFSLPCSRSCLFICNFCRHRFHLQAKRQHMATHINKSFNIFENVQRLSDAIRIYHNLLGVIRLGGMAYAGNRLALFGYAGINVPVFFFGRLLLILGTIRRSRRGLLSCNLRQRRFRLQARRQQIFQNVSKPFNIFKGYQNLSEIMN